jgi:hypothetical protein
MKNLLWITIIGFVLAALAANGAPQPLAPPAALAQTECDCSKLKVLQIELRNALRLQQAFRNKIPELRPENVSTSKNMLQIFARGEARRGLEPITDYKGPSEFDYVSYGDTQDPDQSSRYTRETLCAVDKSASKLLDAAKQASACAGIAAALQAHENYHINRCLSIGYLPYLKTHGADRAQEEVEAYGAQIAVLRAEIAKVLEHANVRIETETNSRMSMPPNPLYTAIVTENRAVVPMSSVSVSGDMIKFEGEGKQTNNATVEGHCKFTGGLPFTITLRGSIETEGLEAQIRLALMGTLPRIAMECATPAGTGHGMSVPVNVGGGTVPLITLPLENGAEKVFDQSAGPAAQQGPVRITGTSKIRLIFCEK